MIKVEFVKDKVYRGNGKLIPKGKVIVLSAEYANECFADGSAIPYNTKVVPDELLKIAVSAKIPTVRGKKEGNKGKVKDGKD